jgi:3-hydroxyisobutyrate dehydrogenase-like beta-hydroxyacid dehydrogenase
MQRVSRRRGEDHEAKSHTGVSLKLLGNRVILGIIQLYSEVYALSDNIGFDPKVFHELHRALSFRR